MHQHCTRKLLVLKFEPPMLASDLQMLPTDSDWHDPASSSRFPSYLTFVSLSRSMSPRTDRKPERSDCRGTPPLYILKTFDSKEQLNVQTATSQEAAKNTKHTFRCLRWILAHSCGEDESPFLLYLQFQSEQKGALTGYHDSLFLTDTASQCFTATLQLAGAALRGQSWLMGDRGG